MGDELPHAMALEQERHPTLMYDSGRPLGPDPRVLALLAERLNDAAAEMPPSPRPLELVGARTRLRAVDTLPAESLHLPIEPGETAVVLVGDGSTDPAANAEIHRVSRLFWETHAYDFMTVETAFVSLTPPGVPGGLERCRRLGAKRVIVVPYLLFAGGALERVWAQALAYGAGHPDLDIRCAEVIGDCETLADVVIDRYEEALQLAPVVTVGAMRLRPEPVRESAPPRQPVTPEVPVLAETLAAIRPADPASSPTPAPTRTGSPSRAARSARWRRSRYGSRAPRASARRRCPSPPPSRSSPPTTACTPGASPRGRRRSPRRWWRTSWPAARWPTPSPPRSAPR